MNDNNVKPETAISPEGVKKGLTTPVVPTINPLSEGLTTPITPTAAQPTETPTNQAPSEPSGQSVNQTSSSNDNG